MILAGKLPPMVLGAYLGASVVAFIPYAGNKAAARRDRWRTPEGTLHLFALVGGWPDALVAQRFLRHKSRKVEFQRVYWATVIVNCMCLGVVRRAARWRTVGPRRRNADEGCAQPPAILWP